MRESKTEKTNWNAGNFNLNYSKSGTICQQALNISEQKTWGGAPCLMWSCNPFLAWRSQRHQRLVANNECVALRSLQGSDSIFRVIGSGQNELFFRLVNMWQMTVQELLIPITLIQCFIVRTDPLYKLLASWTAKPYITCFNPYQSSRVFLSPVAFRFE